MLIKLSLGSLFLAGGMILASWSAGQVANAAEPFMLTSSGFKDGTPLQKKNSNNTPGNANCVGENVSPPLAWSNPPAGTKSFALTCRRTRNAEAGQEYSWVTHDHSCPATGFAEDDGASHRRNTSAARALLEAEPRPIWDPARLRARRTTIRLS